MTTTHHLDHDHGARGELELDALHAELARAREQLEHTRRDRLDGWCGATDVSKAEARLNVALAAVDQTGWQPPTQPKRDDDDNHRHELDPAGLADLDGEGAGRKSGAAPPRPRG